MLAIPLKRGNEFSRSEQQMLAAVVVRAAQEEDATVVSHHPATCCLHKLSSSMQPEGGVGSLNIDWRLSFRQPTKLVAKEVQALISLRNAAMCVSTWRGMGIQEHAPCAPAF